MTNTLAYNYAVIIAALIKLQYRPPDLLALGPYSQFFIVVTYE